MYAFFHAHTGCLDANGFCHSFCQSYTVSYSDGSSNRDSDSTYDTCPDRSSHPGSFATTFPDSDLTTDQRFRPEVRD